ncbi:hypothetical protein HK098_003696 [Nowakowskiella sp. JEL0407]|nr:hypothetical protein HK098_003696 [Nowakowskiella sp. JEL0407]
MPVYEPLLDEYLHDYFNAPNTRCHLIKLGLIDSEGQIIDTKSFKYNQIRLDKEQYEFQIVKHNGERELDREIEVTIRRQNQDQNLRSQKLKQVDSDSSPLADFLSRYPFTMHKTALLYSENLKSASQNHFRMKRNTYGKKTYKNNPVIVTSDDSHPAEPRVAIIHDDISEDDYESDGETPKARNMGGSLTDLFQQAKMEYEEGDKAAAHQTMKNLIDSTSSTTDIFKEPFETQLNKFSDLVLTNAERYLIEQIHLLGGSVETIINELLKSNYLESQKISPQVENEQIQKYPDPPAIEPQPSLTRLERPKSARPNRNGSYPIATDFSDFGSECEDSASEALTSSVSENIPHLKSGSEERIDEEDELDSIFVKPTEVPVQTEGIDLNLLVKVDIVPVAHNAGDSNSTEESAKLPTPEMMSKSSSKFSTHSFTAQNKEDKSRNNSVKVSGIELKTSNQNSVQFASDDTHPLENEIRKSANSIVNREGSWISLISKTSPYSSNGNLNSKKESQIISKGGSQKNSTTKLKTTERNSIRKGESRTASIQNLQNEVRDSTATRISKQGSLKSILKKGSNNNLENDAYVNRSNSESSRKSSHSKLIEQSVKKQPSQSLVNANAERNSHSSLTQKEGSSTKSNGNEDFIFEKDKVQSDNQSNNDAQLENLKGNSSANVSSTEIRKESNFESGQNDDKRASITGSRDSLVKAAQRSLPPSQDTSAVVVDAVQLQEINNTQIRKDDSKSSPAEAEIIPVEDTKQIENQDSMQSTQQNGIRNANAIDSYLEDNWEDEKFETEPEIMKNETTIGAPDSIQETVADNTTAAENLNSNISQNNFGIEYLSRASPPQTQEEPINQQVPDVNRNSEIVNVVSDDNKDIETKTSLEGDAENGEYPDTRNHNENSLDDQKSSPIAKTDDVRTIEKESESSITNIEKHSQDDNQPALDYVAESNSQESNVPNAPSQSGKTNVETGEQTKSNSSSVSNKNSQLEILGNENPKNFAEDITTQLSEAKLESGEETNSKDSSVPTEIHQYESTQKATSISSFEIAVKTALPISSKSSVNNLLIDEVSTKTVEREPSTRFGADELASLKKSSSISSYDMAVNTALPVSTNSSMREISMHEEITLTKGRRPSGLKLTEKASLNSSFEKAINSALPSSSRCSINEVENNMKQSQSREDLKSLRKQSKSELDPSEVPFEKSVFQSSFQRALKAKLPDSVNNSTLKISQSPTISRSHSQNEGRAVNKTPSSHSLLKNELVLANEYSKIEAENGETSRDIKNDSNSNIRQRSQIIENKSSRPPSIKNFEMQEDSVKTSKSKSGSKVVSRTASVSSLHKAMVRKKSTLSIRSKSRDANQGSRMEESKNITENVKKNEPSQDLSDSSASQDGQKVISQASDQNLDFKSSSRPSRTNLDSAISKSQGDVGKINQDIAAGIKIDQRETPTTAISDQTPYQDLSQQAKSDNDQTSDRSIRPGSVRSNPSSRIHSRKASVKSIDNAIVNKPNSRSGSQKSIKPHSKIASRNSIIENNQISVNPQKVESSGSQNFSLQKGSSAKSVHQTPPRTQTHSRKQSTTSHKSREQR